MPIKHLAYTFTVFIIATTTAHAQLSYNPWTDPNDAETIAKYYEKAAKVQSGDAEYYEPEAPTEIDKTSAYIELPPLDSEDIEEDNGILNKVGQILRPKKEPRLIPNTEENRQAVYDMQNDETDNSNTLLDSGKEMLDSAGFDNIKRSIKRKIPKINTSGIIHKFEKAAGINLKSVAKKIRK